MNATLFNKLLENEVPLSDYLNILAVKVDHTHAELEIVPDESAIRPGGRVSGPALFTLVDLAMYAAVLGRYPDETGALTTNISMLFLRRPPLSRMVANCTIASRSEHQVFLTCEVAPSEDLKRIICQSKGYYYLRNT